MFSMLMCLEIAFQQLYEEIITASNLVRNDGIRVLATLTSPIMLFCSKCTQK